MIHAVKGLFGTTRYYDGSGHYVGETMEGLFPGQELHFDSGGKCVGASYEGMFDDKVHTDVGGNIAAVSYGDSHYLSNGTYFAQTYGDDTFFVDEG